MYSIIIVDDEKLLRQGFIHMTNWLEKGYFVVGEAANGLEALELIEKRHPDIVITDIRMPLMDGIELTRIIKERYKNIQVIILSSYSEFEYVKKTMKYGALDYILKQEMEFNDVLNVLEKAKLKIHEANMDNLPLSREKKQNFRESFLNSLVTNNNFDSIIIHDYLRKYEINLESSNLHIILFYYDVHKDNKGKESIYLFHDFLINELTQHVSKDFIDNLFVYSDNLIVTIHNCSRPDISKYHSECRKIAAAFKSKFNNNMWVLFSNLFMGYENIYNVFNDTVRLIEFTFYKQNECILTMDDFKTDFSIQPVDYAMLDSHIELLEFNLIKEKIFNNITGITSSGIYIEPYKLKKYFTEVIYFILFKLNEINIEVQALNNTKFDYFKSIESCSSYHELLSVAENIFFEISQLADKPASKKYPALVNDVIHFIDENYHKGISLSSIAGVFHISRSYLCTYFKDNTGENLMDYITKVRVCKAKELLRESNYNVNEVGYRVGYENTSYFIKVFKKNVVMTPHEYQKLYIK